MDRGGWKLWVTASAPAQPSPYDTGMRSVAFSVGRTRPLFARSAQPLIGRPRTRILLLPAESASTTELTRRLGATPGAVSQHLTVLYDPGLLARSRAERSVRYRRTGLGDAHCR